VLTYTDAEGNEQTKEVPLTPAHFAHSEGRFKKSFVSKPLADDVVGMPVDEYIDLAPADREGKTPFIWEVKKGKLVRFPVSGPMVKLVEERRRNWRTLQNLAGIDADRVDEAHKAEIEALKSRYEAALAGQDGAEAVAAQ
jgi:pyruvate-ferredoxin/flavodoxin oxidoreductase